ncbi:MAG TPA: bacillithiol system redox-active protein YtxJ [Saprospiraceae bacterium]|nr:bacillithiol system redox-active protein YtxJ [Saprospiraceae bacterium]HMP15114.1 bacillithiol system redox-active protein YtxJ [Saprospiraceae bacterium]
MLNWIALENSEQLAQIHQISQHKACIIFKHSSRCAVSSVAKHRLESDWRLDAEIVQAYFLDVIRHRDVSNQVADQFQVWHESPQVLLIRQGTCVYDTSHLDITMEELKSALREQEILP